MGQTLLVLLTLSLLYQHSYCIQVGGRKVWREQNLQSKTTSKSMKKHAVKTIKTDYGDIYDCVDIYKQPAFDHPLLKNHTVQLRPTKYPKGGREYNAPPGVENTGLKDGGCPQGTVPIRRTQMEDLLISKSLSHFRKNTRDISSHGYAIARAPNPRVYYGARAIMNLWNPQLIEPSQFSLAQLWIIAGYEDTINTVEAGWIVFPALYNDSRTRLFSFWTSRGYANGCFNLGCPGFVQVNKHIPVDYAYERISKFGDKQYETLIDIYKDPITGNWFLIRDNLVVGYWPKWIFNYLRGKAHTLEWGGEIAAACQTCQYPEMGSGHSPTLGYGKAAYMRDIQMSTDPSLVLKDAKGCNTFATRPKCYQIQASEVGEGPLSGYHFLYGGTGGFC